MKITLLFIVVAGLLTSGCESFREGYKKQPWTPDNFNYTLQRDRHTGEFSDYFGLSWGLK